MGLFSSKNDKNVKSDKSDKSEKRGRNAKSESAGKSEQDAGRKAQGNTPSGNENESPSSGSTSASSGGGAASSMRSGITAGMKKLSKGGGTSTDQNERGSQGRGQERGSTPPTGGNTVATIGKSIIIKGDLSGDEDLIIEGKVDGRVQLPNNEITVGSDGRITADIEAKSIVVVGHTAGNLNATQRVEVQATGTVEGDILAPSLQIQEGATVNGTISMTKSAAPAKPASDGSSATPIAEPARKSA